MIKDTMQLQGFPTMKLPKIKGTVEIRLHNPTTGKTEIHKGENMVTDAIADIFASNYCGALDYRKVLPLYSKMYGGILCFASTLNVDSPTVADAKKDYYIPDNSVNTVTAHAGQTSYTDQADDTTRGNPSSANMSVEDGTVTLSWEWGLSSGNGPISALALTHTDVGDAGTGSTSNAFKSMTPYINAYSSLTGTSLIRFVANDGYGYNISASGNTLTIVRIPMAYTKTGLIALAPYTSNSLETTKTKTLNFTCPTNRMPYYCFDKDNSKLYLFLTDGTNTSVKCDCVNLSDWSNITVTSNDFTAQVSGGITAWSTQGTGPIQAGFYNGSVYLQVVKSGSTSDTTKVLRVNMSNSADQTLLTPDTAVSWGGGAAYPNVANKVFATKFYVVNGGNIYKTSYATPDYFAGPDYGSAITNSPYVCSQKGLSALCSQQTQGTSEIKYYVAISKFYLGTKYNLSSAVQKTPSQSMLITYTLTEVAPE